MPRTLALSRRLRILARWPVGINLASYRYIWRTTPMYRREVEGSQAEDAPPPLPSEADLTDAQHPDDGVGPLFRRRYQVVIRDAELSPEELLQLLAAKLDRIAPAEMAAFCKVEGEEEAMRVGDEYLVRMPGPWDGPVRVVELTPVSFRLVTLAGHLEAGQIDFRFSRDGDGHLRFEIESWARSGDRLSDFFFQHMRMAKEVQLHLWVSMLEQVTKLSGGKRVGGVDIDTRRVD